MHNVTDRRMDGQTDDSIISTTANHTECIWLKIIVAGNIKQFFSIILKTEWWIVTILSNDILYTYNDTDYIIQEKEWRVDDYSATELHKQRNNTEWQVDDYQAISSIVITSTAKHTSMMSSLL